MDGASMHLQPSKLATVLSIIKDTRKAKGSYSFWSTLSGPEAVIAALTGMIRPNLIASDSMMFLLFCFTALINGALIDKFKGNTEKRGAAPFLQTLPAR